MSSVLQIPVLTAIAVVLHGCGSSSGSGPAADETPLSTTLAAPSTTAGMLNPIPMSRERLQSVCPVAVVACQLDKECQSLWQAMADVQTCVDAGKIIFTQTLKSFGANTAEFDGLAACLGTACIDSTVTSTLAATSTTAATPSTTYTTLTETADSTVTTSMTPHQSPSPTPPHGKSLQFSWKDCGTSSTHGHVTSLTASPDPAPLGKPATITTKGKLDEQLTSATYEAKVQILGLTLVDHKDSLCGESSFDISVLFVGKVGSVTVHGPPCPAPPGDFDFGVEVTLEDAPAGVPTGGIATITLAAKDQSGADLLCLEIDAKIIGASGLALPITQTLANAINTIAASEARPIVV